MSDDAQTLCPLPGLEVVGHGIYLEPYQPYRLTAEIFPQKGSRVFSSKEAKQSYSVPDGYNINDSPPYPPNESLNQVMIEESWDRFEKQMNLDANVAVSTAPFSISATSSMNSSLRSEQEAYYALRSSFVPLWMVYTLPDPQRCIPEVRNPDLPDTFRHEDRDKFEEFFRRYGSHYVRGAWVGGKSNIVFTVLKSSNLTKSDIQAGVKASFAVASGGVDAKKNESRDRLRNSSQCTVFGKGGQETLLAAMSTLEEESYKAWLNTISENPQVIHLDVAGVWTLVEDKKKAKALLDAYWEQVTFDPIDVALDVQRRLTKEEIAALEAEARAKMPEGKKDGGSALEPPPMPVRKIARAIIFIRGPKYVFYDRDLKVAYDARPVSELLPGLEDVGFDGIDAAFRGSHLVSPSGEPLDRKFFVFRNERYVRFNMDTHTIDPGYPKPIREGWPGVTFDRIDTAMVTAFDSVYFFYGGDYIRFNPVKGRADEGYPQPVNKRWLGVTFDRIDSAVYWGGSKVYFFQGDQHIRYDLATLRADPGYPKHTIGNYVENWSFIE